MAKRDYYVVLGVSRQATAEEIRRAHRKLVRQYHPDVNPDSASAAEKFREVQEAYDALSDPQRRALYDQFGHAEPRPAPRGRARRAPDPGDFGGFDPSDFGDGQFASIFEQVFGGRARGRRGGERPSPRDVEYPVTLTFEQAARGATLPLRVRRGGETETIEVKIPAGVSDGSRVRVRGRAGEADIHIIPTVQAHPHFRRDGLHILLDLPLSMYEAVLGTRVDVPTLDGPVTLTIPPGTSSGSKLRIRGRGVRRDGESGDQIVVVRVMVPRDLDEQDRVLIEQLQRRRPLSPRRDLGW